MNENVYSPPEASLETEETSKGSPVKAVIIATLADLLGSTLIGFIIGFAIAFYLIAQGVPQDQIPEALLSVSDGSVLFWLGGVLGGMVTICCGYLCARIGKCTGYRLVGIYVLLTILIAYLFRGDQELDFNIEFLLTFLTVVCAFFGAWLYIRK